MKKLTRWTAVISVILVFALSPTNVWAGKKKGKQAPLPVALTEKGKALMEKYTKIQENLKSEITKELPKVPTEKQTTFLKALVGLKDYLTDEYNKTKAVEACKATSSWRLGRAERGLEKAIKELQLAEANLKAAEARPDSDSEKAAILEKAKADLKAKTEKKKKATAGLEKAKAKAKEARAKEPSLVKEQEAASKALQQAKADLAKAYYALGVDSFLAGEDMREQLLKYIVITEATPRGLAEFGQKGSKQVALIQALLASPDLMEKMLVADGAKDGHYGQAMEILTTIYEKYPKSKEGVLGNLALAISVEHATPVPLRNATGLKDAPEFADPVKRYKAYESAYLNGELDPGFKEQDSYNLRMVVSGEEPDEISVWGRKMLSNYRPDHITTDDYRWRYVATVKTDVRYGSQDNKYDEPELQFFQNILKNGGVCGRRAFFGRFILRAFGVPTMARPQPGHAALIHWTPDGWVVCLGGGWGRGGTHSKYGKDLDFLANVQARENESRFKKVKRAQWIGELVGEKKTFGLNEKTAPQFWYGVSLYEQMAINDEAKAKALAAVGTDIGEANESVVKDKVEKAEISDEDKKIVIGKDGSIMIPAAACSNPTNSTDKIKFMKSNLGGMQLHYQRLSKPETFEYTFAAPKAGKYALTARVVTPSWKQHLFVSVNGAKDLIDIALPFTVGMWETTKPVEVDLVKGKNVLTFSREHENVKGISIRDFTLTLVQ